RQNFRPCLMRNKKKPPSERGGREIRLKRK
ncbi:hypothetical protein, partial [Escherichia coli]